MLRPSPLLPEADSFPWMVVRPYGVGKLKLAPFLVFDRKLQQELSYRKQIARQLRTQFVDGITVTLKSTLRVTQGQRHWKRNHTQLSVGR